MSMPPSDRAPLKPAAFHILLALAGGERHGLGIAEDVEDISSGAMQLGPATLYRTLKELTAAGLIRDVRLRGADVDPRRRYYSLTETGRQALRTDAVRYERLSKLARQRGVLSAQAP